MASAWPYEGACVVIEPLQQPIFAVPKPTPFARINGKDRIANIVVVETNNNGLAACSSVAALGCLLARCNGLRVERRQIYYQKL